MTRRRAEGTPQMEPSDRSRPTFTSEEAVERIEGLRRVFAQGFLTRDELETLERHVLDRARKSSRRAA